MSVKLVLDTSALLAYAAGDIAVGETIGEAVDEDNAFAVPALCLVEAAAGTKADGLGLLRVLAAAEDCTVVAMSPDWQALADGTRVYGTVARATAAELVRHLPHGYILTSEPAVYAGLPTVEV